VPSKQNPLALPDGYFSPGTCLNGLVVPRDATKHDPLLVEIPLSSADYVTIDRSSRYRGFWIIISSSPATSLPDDATMPACYWLHDPDESIAPGAVKSQAQVHFDHRAWLAVLSNLIDALFPDFDKGAKYANQGVHEVYEALKRGDDEEPFDKAVLIRYKDKIKPHLIGAQGYLTKTCAFVKSINNMRPPKGRKNPKQKEELVRSTEAAERRSNQYPWGEPKSTDNVDAEQQILTEPENSPLAHLSDVSACDKMATAKAKNSHGVMLAKTDEDVACDFFANKSKKRSLCGEAGSSLQNVGDDKESVASSSKRKTKRLKQVAPDALWLPSFAEDEMGKALVCICVEYMQGNNSISLYVHHTQNTLVLANRIDILLSLCTEVLWKFFQFHVVGGGCRLLVLGKSRRTQLLLYRCQKG
jgi:hypothetical protein